MVATADELNGALKPGDRTAATAVFASGRRMKFELVVEGGAPAPMAHHH